jgi:DNA mismatch repair protein MutL
VQSKSFPSYFIYLTVDPKKIDVNVHPTKTEIKFEEDRLIYSILLSSVRQALGKYNIAPTLDFERETSFDIPHEMKFQPAVEPTIKVNSNFNPFQTTSRPISVSSGSGNSFTKAIKAEGFGTKNIEPSDWENFYSIEETTSTKVPVSLEIKDENLPKNYLIRGKYLLTPCKSGILVIDSQRAHERIVYDELMAQFISKPISSQQLLFPIEREFSSNEKMEWLNNSVLLERLGFLGNFTDKIFHLSAVPAILQEESIHLCIDLILENVAFQEIDKGEIAHVLVQAIATAAGRNKEPLQNNASAENLVEQLFQCEDHAYSPKGKKIIETISLEEIASKF